MEHGAHEVHDHHTDPQDMRFMGGLRKKMPITFWTFLFGGLALSGFPLVTAGFWSKDEIFAEAWFHWTQDSDILSLIIFVMLAAAAFLTAFYTMRQISLTFLGKPRTPLAEHAHESNYFMTIPLILLSVFAIAAGWFGISEGFPVLGSALNYNYFHHIVGATVFESLHELREMHLVDNAIEALPFVITPIGTSIFVALGGLFLGWWIYGRKPLKEGQTDPLVRPLGPLYTFLNRKWYWDELYQAVFINPTIYISEVVVAEYIDKGIIDGTLHLVARVTYRIGYYAKWFEENVISNGVDWLKDGFLSIAEEFRYLQTGRVQEYVLISTLIATALIAVILLINYGWLAGLF